MKEIKETKMFIYIKVLKKITKSVLASEGFDTYSIKRFLSGLIYENNNDILKFFVRKNDNTIFTYKEDLFYYKASTCSWKLDKKKQYLKKQIRTVFKNYRVQFKSYMKDHIEKIPVFIFINFFEKKISNLFEFEFIENLEKELKIKFQSKNNYKKLFKRKDIITFNNCIYDFKLMRYRYLLKQDFIYKKLNYSYDKLFCELKTIDFIRNVFLNNSNLNFILKRLYMTLSGQENTDIIFIFHGKNNSGINIFLKLIKHTFGYLVKILNKKKIKDVLIKNKNTCLCKVTKEYHRIIISDQFDDYNDNLNIFNSLINNKYDKGLVRACTKKNCKIENKLWILTIDEKEELNNVPDNFKKKIMYLNFPFTFCQNPNNSFEKHMNNEMFDKITTDKESPLTLIKMMIKAGLLARNKHIKFSEEIQNIKDEHSVQRITDFYKWMKVNLIFAENNILKVSTILEKFYEGAFCVPKKSSKEYNNKCKQITNFINTYLNEDKTSLINISIQYKNFRVGRNTESGYENLGFVDNDVEQKN